MNVHHAFHILWLTTNLYFSIASNKEGDLMNHLFTNYSASVRPVIDCTKPIEVQFNMALRQLVSMDERAQTLQVQVDYIVTWKNELLQWNPKDWGDVDEIFVTIDKVWTPALTLLNNADKVAPQPHAGTDMVSISASGENNWYPIVTSTVSFTNNVKYFPFDLQNVTFVFESWVLDVHKLNIVKTNYSSVSQYYVVSPEWKVAGTQTMVHKKKYDGVPNPYCQIHFTYMLLRKPSYYVVSLILPCVLLLLIILFSHFLPAASGERMGVVITILLAFAVFLEVVSSSMPPNSDHISVISLFYLSTMTLCALSFLATCIVITMIHKLGDSLPPWWARRYFLRVTASNKKSHIQCNGNHSYQDIETGDILCSPMTHDDFLGSNDKPNPENHGIIKQMGSILKKQDDLLKMIKKKEEEGKKQNAEEEQHKEMDKEWKQFALYMDRICFCFFLVLFISTSLGILMPAYNKYLHLWEK